MTSRTLFALIIFFYSHCNFAADVDSKSVENILPEFSRQAEKAMKTLHVPGMAIAIVKGDKVIYSKGFGVRKVGTKLPVTPETVFQIASVSKPMTSTILAMLVGKNKISFDTKVADLDPDFKLSDQWITNQLILADLLSHRSSLPDHAGDLLEDLGYTKEDILFRLRYIKNLDKFRLSNNYTNFGYSEAAYAVAKSMGTSWDTIFQQYLTKPLNMKSTSITFADYEKTDNKAIGHTLINGEPKALFKRNPDAQAPAGGVNSNVVDMSQWLILQINNGKYHNESLVDEKALKFTHTPQNIIGKVNGSWNFYGLGWNITKSKTGQVKISHSGAFALGARSQVAYLPEEKIGIIILSNAAITGLPEIVSQLFFDLLDNGKVTQDWVSIINDKMVSALDFPKQLTQKPNPVYPSLPLENYAGTYHNDYFGNINIIKEGNQLTAIIGPKAIRFQLTHWNHDTFYLDTIGENATGRSPVNFVMNEDGKAIQVVISAYDKFGTGRFVRV